MKEQDLERLINQQAEEQAGDLSEQKFQKKVRRAMNRTMYTRILSVLAAVVLVGVLAVSGTSAAMNLLCYRPGQEDSFMDESYGKGAEFAFLLEETVNMNYPGMRCRVIPGDDGDYYTARGFGRYDVDVSLTNTFDSVALPCPPTHSFHIGMSEMTGPIMLNTGFAPFVRLVDEFAEPGSDHTSLSENTPQSVKEELAKLPDSAQLDVSVSFESYLSADEVADLMHTHPGVQFQWLALKGQEQSVINGIAGGMFLYSIYGDMFNEEAAQRYPGYFLPNPDEITGADLEQCLRSRLQLQVDHPEFAKLMSSNLKELLDNNLLRQRLENAQKEWACFGMRLMMGKEDLQQMMEKLPMTQIVVNDVKVSRYQK